MYNRKYYVVTNLQNNKTEIIYKVAFLRKFVKDNSGIPLDVFTIFVKDINELKWNEEITIGHLHIKRCRETNEEVKIRMEQSKQFKEEMKKWTEETDKEWKAKYGFGVDEPNKILEYLLKNNIQIPK